MANAEKKKAYLWFFISTAILLAYLYIWGTEGKLFVYMTSLYVCAIAFLALDWLGFTKHE
jgi:hypothetical protein